LAIIFGLFSAIYTKVGSFDLLYIFTTIFYCGAGICLSLAFFYLLPIPGLDGYKAMLVFTPSSWNEFFYKLEKYSLFIFIGIILIGEYIPGINLFFSIPQYILTFFGSISTSLWSLIF